MEDDWAFLEDDPPVASASTSSSTNSAPRPGTAVAAEDDFVMLDDRIRSSYSDTHRSPIKFSQIYYRRVFT
jgi:hypothetical protein